MEYDFSFYGIATDFKPPLRVRWQELKRPVDLSKKSHTFSFFSKDNKNRRDGMSSWSSKRIFMGVMRFQRSSCFSKNPPLAESICFKECFKKWKFMIVPFIIPESLDQSQFRHIWAIIKKVDVFHYFIMAITYKILH